MTSAYAMGACQGKEGYATQAKAIAVIERRRKRARLPGKHKDRRRELATLGAYHCPICHHWHVGSHDTLKGGR